MISETGNGIDISSHLNDTQARLTNGFGIGATPVAQSALRPIDMLTADLEPSEEEKEVSLDTLSKKEITKIMEAVQRGKDVADNYYTSTIRPKLQEREQTYWARKSHYREKFPRLSETSEFCSRDIKTTITWMLPSLEEPFLGTDDPVEIRSVNVNDDQKAKKIQQLLKYQVQRKNSYPTFIEAVWKDAMKLNWAVAKVWWKRDEDRQRYKQIVSADNMQFVVALQQEVQQGHAEIIDIKPVKEAPDLQIVTFDKITVKSNYPVLQYMSPSELRYTPDGRSVQDAKFVAHRKIVMGDYLKRKEKEGIYKNIDKAIENFNGDTSPDQLDTEKNKELPTIKDKLNDGDIASKPFELYESYISVDYNNDGIYESLIVHSIGNEPIRIAKNEFEMSPFFNFAPIADPLNAFNENEGFTDDLEQQQDLKTAIFRQVITNVAKNNAPQIFANNNVDVDALINGDEIVLVDTNENPATQVYGGSELPISQLSMQVIEYAQNEIEAQSGSTRYNQGLDSNSLNKTATGITAILGSAEKRMKQLSRMFAENFLLPVIKYIILLDQKYMDQEQIIRLTDENIIISRDELSIDYDLIINVGLGAGTKEAQIQYLMVLINQIYPILAQNGLVTEKSWYGIVSELLEKMGIRNAQNYILDPESQEAIAQKQAQQEAAQAQAEKEFQLAQIRAQWEIEKARQPHITIRYEDLPPKAKMDVLNYLGTQVGANDIIQKEKLDVIKNSKTAPVQRNPQGSNQPFANSKQNPITQGANKPPAGNS